MALNYITVTENDLSGGIDQRSSENLLAQGYSEDLLNVDVIEKRLRKRIGNQGYAGYLPVRVSQITYNTEVTNNITFTLDGSINMSDIRSTPILVYGRTSSQNDQGGKFPSGTDVMEYYPSFSADFRKPLTAPSGTLALDEDDHGLGTNKLFVGVVESTNPANLSNNVIIPDRLAIDVSTGAVDIDYSIPEDISAFVYYADKSSVAGDTYVGADAGTGTTYNIPASTQDSFTITGSTHSLDSFRIIPKIYEDTGAEYIEIIPENVILDPSTGDVTVTINNQSPSGINVFAILSTPPATNAEFRTANPTISETINITSPAGQFPFIAAYVEGAGGNLEQVIPDDITYNALTDTLSITVTNNSPSPVAFEVYYEFGQIVSNQLTVTDDSVLGTGFVDSNPQLTIWGLNHEEIYGSDKQGREGWVNHIDGYRRTLEERLVAGLGGNIFAARTRDEVGVTYEMPLFYPNLRARASTTQVLAPAFWSQYDTAVSRSRGYVRATGGGDNLLDITSATWLSGSQVQYTISTPDRQLIDSNDDPLPPGSLGSIISTTSGLEDWLTVTQMGYSVLNGTFRIVATSEVDANTITITVENTEIENGDYDEDDAGGAAGIFTEQLTTVDTSPFAAGDRLYSEAISSNFIITVIGSDSTTTVLDGVTSKFVFPGSLRLRGERTSPIIPIRDEVGGANVTNIVGGDEITITNVERSLRVIAVNVKDNQDISSITGNGATATLVLASGDTTVWREGQKLQLANAGVYTGTITIDQILDSTTILFDSTLTDSAATDQLDNTIEYQVGKRWIPIEAPDDNYDLTPNTYQQHLDINDYTGQELIRSTMVNDSMFFTTGTDEVMKFDGTNIYRAGLPRWQPALFVSTDTTAAGRIDLEHRDLEYIDYNHNRFVIDAEDELIFAIGDKIQPIGSDEVYTVTEIKADDTASPVVNAQLYVDRPIDKAVPTSGALVEVSSFRYYFRIQAIDANDNIVVAAATGDEDFRVNLSLDAAVQLRLVGFPAWHIYDYDRIECEIYRTTANTATFYRIATIPMSFDQDDGYFNYLDTNSDDTLTEDPVDTNIGTTGAEIGRGYTEPLRAKYVTSDGNRLLLGNITDYPQLDIRMLGSVVTNTDLNGMTWTFRRDASQDGVPGVADMENITRYEFVLDTAGEDVTSITGIADTSFTAAATTTPAVGDWVYMYHQDDNDPTNHTFIPGDVNTGSDDITITAHGYVDDDPVVFFNTNGELPLPLIANTKYYVVGATANTFQVSATVGGPAINLTSSGTGTHIVIFQNHNDMTYTGWFQVDSVNAGVDFTINYKRSEAGSAEHFPNRWISATAGTDIPVLLGQDDNIGTIFGNDSSSDILMAMQRLGSAINASMRQISTTPWLIAQYGGEFDKGQLVIRQPRADVAIPEVILHSSFPTADTEIFINNLRREASEQVAASERIFPSRVVLSYANYPEIFDKPNAAFAGSGVSAVDINSADGQEITGMLPFFGDATTSDSQKESVVIVFKTNSVYLLNSQTQQVTKLETRGLGCTAPGSIAVARDGVIFANNSGVYRIDRQFQMRYVGRFMERNWLNRVNKDQLAVAQATHYAPGHQYKISVPIGEDSANSEVYVYNHSSETEAELAGGASGRMGSWSRYDSHNATGWANLSTNAYWASTCGRVFALRNTGERTDYRDDNQPINAEITYRAMDFGNAGIRKAVANVISYYRSASPADGTKLLFAENLGESFLSTQDFLINRNITPDNLSDQGNTKVQTIRHSFSSRKMTHMQLKWTNANIDEPLELPGFAVKVAALTRKGIQEAADTAANE
jgi:hypothetical protein